MKEDGLGMMQSSQLRRGIIGNFDFDIRISAYDKGRQGWPVHVNSPAGQENGLMHFTPFIEEKMKHDLENLSKALARRWLDPETPRVTLPPDEQSTQELGQILFEALIAGRIRDLYRASKLLADSQDQRLRLVLHTAGVPELMTLPWELLHDSRDNNYLCLLRTISLIRYIDLPMVIPPLEISGPLRILVVGANPDGVSKLNIPRELRLIRNALRSLEIQGLVQLRSLGEQTTLRDLTTALAEGSPWHIVHFICHGGFDTQRTEGFITLVSDHGEGRRIFATGLARLFVGRIPRLVLLNSCEGALGGIQDAFSSIASILTHGGIPAVLAMQYGIADAAAVEFADTFYTELAKAAPVDAAVTEARLSLSLHHGALPEWGTPVLYMRSRNSTLFRRTPRGCSPGIMLQALKNWGYPLVFPKPRPLWHWLIMFVVGVLLLSGLGVGHGLFASPKSSPTPSPVLNSQSYCLGTDFPTSSLGDNAQGILLKNGADLAIIQNHDLGSGYTLNHCDKDDTSPVTYTHDPQVGADNVNALILDKAVLGLVGPGNSNVALKEIPIAASASLPMVGPYTSALCLTLPRYCASADQVHPVGIPSTFFRTCSNDQQQSQAINLLFKSKGWGKVFVVDDSDIYGQELAEIFTKGNGANILGHEHISTNEKSAQLAQLAQKIVSSHPDVVFYGGVTSNGGGRLKEQLVRAGFTGPLIGGAGIADDQQFLDDAGSAADNTYAIALGPDPSTLPQSFIQAYQHYYGGGVPSKISAQSYDAAMILITAIKSLIKTNPQIMHSNDVRAIRKAVQLNIQPYRGLAGPITFDSNGDNSAAKSFITYVVKGGRWTINKGDNPITLS